MKWFILIILPGNVGAYLAESVQLFFDFLCRGLDVGPDPLEVLLVIHFRSGISDNLDVFWKEVVSIL